MNLLNQKIQIKEDHRPRLAFIKSFCRGKKVLHVGCYDHPIFDPENNLHLMLAPHTKQLDGVDIVPGYSDEISKYYNDGSYFYDISLLHDKYDYDIIIMPEVIEHTTSPGHLLYNLFGVKTKEILITAPNAYKDRPQTKYDSESGVFNEFVHKDHKAWYSPYTLYNTVSPYIKEPADINMYFIKNRGSVVMHIKYKDA